MHEKIFTCSLTCILGLTSNKQLDSTQKVGGYVLLAIIHSTLHPTPSMLRRIEGTKQQPKLLVFLPVFAAAN